MTTTRSNGVEQVAPPDENIQPLSDDSQGELERQKAIECICRAGARGLTRVYAADVPKNDALFQEIDQVLEQATTLARQELIAHAVCARFDTHVIVLLDQDPEYDWLLPAVRQRLVDAASTLDLEIDPSESQLVDLSRGQKLRFMGFEFRSVKDQHGTKVQYERVDQPDKPSPEVDQIERTPPAQRRGWLDLVRWSWLGLVESWGVVRGIGGYARRRWLRLTTAAAALAGLVCLVFFFYPRPEVPAPHMPPGFYLGKYQPAWDAEAIEYGLYLPPHFSSAEGPFPLIVFLHGYPERGIKGVWGAGLSQSIVLKFGEHTANGRFEFAAFFPNDPKGWWELEPAQLAGVVKALDQVIKRHRIDPRRVYLTGQSRGCDGVWRLAEAYPEKWAAVAAVGGFIDPDLAKVRQIPTWIFHGAKDDLAPVERARALVQQLKEAKADVRYTEVPDRKHVIWREVYNPKELYDWFATKTRP
jgi:pimeloyl-ACP methyl ester carboxylesterase